MYVTHDQRHQVRTANTGKSPDKVTGKKEVSSWRMRNLSEKMKLALMKKAEKELG